MSTARNGSVQLLAIIGIAHVEYRIISWNALERAEVAVNPLLPLI